MNTTIKWAIGIAASLAIVFAVYQFIIKPSIKPPKTNREAAMDCTTHMATEFHIHPYLEIIVDGKPLEIPADVGITNGCMNALHTHDNTGKIHVEYHEKRDFTLSDFFAVWNKVYHRDQILDYKTDDTHRIRQTVNGEVVQDYENTILRDHDKIIIYYEGI